MAQIIRRFNGFRKSIVAAAFRKTHRLARHLQKCSGYPLMKYEIAGNKNRQEQISTGSAEQYYTELTKQAAFTILMKLPEKEEGEKAYEELQSFRQNIFFFDFLKNLRPLCHNLSNAFY